ncbi:MAG TPA: hypothetical protein VE244_04990 [Nitrososphaeraceae archaeon]|nr:hypothetical protein [Nitrososphaeraceae archaeon]
MSKVILSDRKGIREIIIFDDRNEKQLNSRIEKKILNEYHSEIIVKQWIIDD